MEDEVLDAAMDVARWAGKKIHDKPLWQTPFYLGLLLVWAAAVLVFLVVIFPLLWFKEKFI